MTKKKGRTGPSDAQQQKPAVDRAEELSKQGMTDRELGVVLRKEGYKTNEIMSAIPNTGMSITQFISWLKGNFNPDDPQSATAPADQQPASKDNNNGKETESLTVRKVSGEQKEKYASKTDDGNLLEKFLRGTSGISAEKIPQIIELYEMKADEIDQDPAILYNLLTMSGISPYKAEKVFANFLRFTKAEDYEGIQPLMMMNARGQTIPMFFNPLSKSYEKGKGNNNEESDEDPEIAKLDKLMTKAMYIRMMDMFGGGGGSEKKNKNFEEMKELLQLRMMAGVAQAMNGGGFGMGGMGGMSPFMAPEIEFALSEDGKPITDAMGNPVPVRIRQVPIPMMQQQQQTQKETTDSKVIEILGNALSSEKENSASNLKVLADGYSKLQEQQMGYLSDRLNVLEGQDPTDGIITMVSKLKELGVYGDKSTDNIEIKKLDMDLNKWKHEQNTQLQKWIWEQKQTMADKQYARQQLKEIGNSVRYGIDKIGSPVMTEFVKGARDGAGGGGRRPQNGGGQRQQQQQQQPQQQGRNTEIKDLSNEELVATAQEADNAYRTVEAAKRNIAQEMKNRGLSV
jgi:hypothetical protein